MTRLGRIIPLLFAAIIAAGSAHAVIRLPEGSVLTREDPPAPGRYLIPTGPWRDGDLPVAPAEGALSRQVWRIDGYGGTVAGLMAAIEAQLIEAGFESSFFCEARACGGFDFRFALDIAAEPEMHVNLADFAFLSASAPVETGDGETGTEHVALLVSAGGGSGYVHLVRVRPEDAPPVIETEVVSSTRAPEANGIADAPGSIAADLASTGRANLYGLLFETGSSSLSDEAFPALEELGRYLAENPGDLVTLVGHTDAEGSLEANIELSRSRAEAVRRRLIERHGVAPERLRAEGVGFLMPLAPNTTDEGRERNRRVEAVVINTE